MKLASVPITLLLFIVSIAPANAMVLRGVVTEVSDGQTVVVFSGGRNLTVFLAGVDAPELQQDFGEASRQHLAYLVLDKAAEVEFSQLQGDHVIGKVISNKLDIGLQVIRDGAAWKDRTTGFTLSEIERSVYAEAEQLARNELRGLWQDGTPMPPWEWRRAQAARHSPQSTYRGSGQALLTEDLVLARRAPLAYMATDSKGARSLAKPTAKPFNTPGQDADFQAYLNQGRISIAYFYANWCPACRRLTPLMHEVNARVPDMQVVFLDIDDWNTPVARQHGVTFVPYLKIYDKDGSLLADGKGARAWLERAMSERK